MFIGEVQNIFNALKRKLIQGSKVYLVEITYPHDYGSEIIGIFSSIEKAKIAVEKKTKELDSKTLSNYNFILEYDSDFVAQYPEFYKMPEFFKQVGDLCWEDESRLISIQPIYIDSFVRFS